MAIRKEIRNSTAEFLIFQIEGKEQGVEVYYKDKTVWCTQKAMGMLFDCSTDNIGLHLKNIFASGELEKDSVTEKISATASDGKTYQVEYYNLDMILSIGYRVKSDKRPLVCINEIKDVEQKDYCWIILVDILTRREENSGKINI